VEKEILDPRKRTGARWRDGVEICRTAGLARGILVIEGKEEGNVAAAAGEVIEALGHSATSDGEPLLNMLCTRIGDGWRLILFPRRKHRPEPRRGRLEMVVVRRRGAGARAVVQDNRPRTEVQSKPQKCRHILRKRLGKMAAVRDRQMARKDRHRIAQNEIVAPVEDRPLFRREMVGAEETGAAPEGFRIEVRPAADDPLRIELDFNAPAVAAELA
jgi:hypothetical protein